MRYAHILLSLIGAALSNSPAQSADLPEEPAPVVINPLQWTGLYVGLQGGGGWGDKDWELNIPEASFDAGAGFDTSGWLGGGQIGYNYQIDQIVLGVEGDFAWTDIEGSASVTAPNTEVATFRASIDWIATATGRVGWSWDRSLFYVKAGGAWAKEEFSFDSPTLGVSGSDDKTRSGWTVGAGWEWAFLDNWSARMEYDYVDFGTHRNLDFGDLGSIPVPPPPPPSEPPDWDVDQDIHTIKIGLNYRFGS